MAELLARVRALLRRQLGQNSPMFEKGGFCFDTRMGRALVDGIAVNLTAQEAAVLTYLVTHAGRLVSRTELSEHIYAYDDDKDSNTIAVFVARLRKKLGAEVIQTLRGRGYMIEPA
jgi:two-component system, OmpR family, response regulator